MTDMSGYNLNGTIVGATWTAGGRFGNALSFNGATSYVDLGNPAALAVNRQHDDRGVDQGGGQPGEDGQIVAKSNGAGWQFKTSPDTGRANLRHAVSGTRVPQRYSTTVRSLNTWYHVAGVYNATAGTLNMYVNGVLDNGSVRDGAAGALNQRGERQHRTPDRRLLLQRRHRRIADLQPRAVAAEIQTDMNTPLDVTVPFSDLTVASAHSGTFTQGQTGASYTLTASNTGTGPTSGTVTVAEDAARWLDGRGHGRARMDL